MEERPARRIAQLDTMLEPALLVPVEILSEDFDVVPDTAVLEHSVARASGHGWR